MLEHLVNERPLVDIRNISVLYSGVPALDGVSLRLNQGEHTALMGPNGSGKSTLLRVIRAECFPTPSPESGIAWYPEGTPDASPLAGRALSALVSISQAEHHLRSRWKITGQELLLGGLYDSPILYGTPSDEEEAKARAMAERLNISDLLNADLGRLSRTQLMLLLFARAYIRRPKLLLLDEFLDNLDPRRRGDMLEFLEVAAQTTTLVAATHREENLPACIRRFVYMDKGRMLAASPFAQTVGQTPTPPPVPRGTAAPESPVEKPLFVLQNADVYLEGARVLHGVTWTVRHGEHWTVTGAPGAGKSVLLRLLAGDLHPAHGGSIERNLPGQTAFPPPVAELRRHMRLVSADIQAGYTYEVTGEQFVLSGLDGGFIFLREPTETERAEARRWMSLLDVAHLGERDLPTLSTGQMRRFMLARALIAAPRVLLLDDPFAGLDPESRARVMGLLDRMSRSENIQIIMITRHPEDIFMESGRVAVLHEGRFTVEAD